MVWETYFSDFYYLKFINKCFMAQICLMVYLGKCSMYTWKECIDWHCWMEYSECQVQLVDSVAQVIYILINFLPTCSINYWERSVELSVDLYNFIFRTIVLPCVFGSSVLLHNLGLLYLGELTSLIFCPPLCDTVHSSEVYFIWN